MADGQSNNLLVLSGSLSCALRLSQITGTAPVTFTKMRANHRGCLSRTIFVIGNFVAIISTIISLGIIFIFFKQIPEEEFSISKRKDQLIKISNCIILYFVTIIASATGSMRMRRMVVYLEEIQKEHRPRLLINKTLQYIHRSLYRINVDLATYCLRIKNEKEKWAYLIIITILGHLTYAAMYTTFLHTFETLKFLIFASYYMHNVMRLTMRMQFSVIAMTVLQTVRRYNEFIKDLLQEIRIEGHSKLNPVILISRAGLKINNYTIPVSSINKIIDAMQLPKSIERKPALLGIDFADGPRKDIQQKLLILMKIYESLCNVVQDVNQCHGLLLLLFLFSDFIHLITALYYILVAYLYPSASVEYIDVVPILWIFYYAFGMYIIIEPCHRTQSEMSTTKELIGKIQTSLNNEIVPEKLEMFINQLDANDVTYTPMDMCTMNRALAVSILSSITTYLVVVLQF